MLRNLPRFFSWRTVLIIVISCVRAVIGPVIPVMMPVAVAALMTVMPLITLMAEMAIMAQMFSWVGRSAKVGFRVAVTAKTGITSFRIMSPGHESEPCNKQKTYRYN